MDITEKIDTLLINEGIYKKVIRKGKIVKKLFCQPGFKAVGTKCIKMTATEMRTRSRSTKKAQRKLQANAAKVAMMQRKMQKSLKKRGMKIPDVIPGGTTDPMGLKKS